MPRGTVTCRFISAFYFFHAHSSLLAWSIPCLLTSHHPTLSSCGLHSLSEKMSINRTSEFRNVLAEKKVSTPEPHRKRVPKADPGQDVFNKEYLKEGYAVVCWPPCVPERG